MRTVYRSFVIEVNTDNQQVVFDVYNRSRQHLLAGFSQQNIGERAAMDLMKGRVDQMILERPVEIFR